MKRRTPLLLLLLLCVSYGTVAKKAPAELNMVALEYDGAIQQDKRGALDFMLQDLAEQSGIPHLYEVLSPARGARKFYRNQATCVIPSSDYAPYFDGMNVIHSVSFAKVSYVAFTRADQPVIEDKAQLSGKVIGVLRDADVWDYEQRFAIDNAEYVQVSNLKSLVQMLQKKRIDVAIHDESEFLAMSEQLKLPRPNVDLNLPIAVDNVVITCHDTPLSRSYMARINPVLQHIVAQGMEKYYSEATNNSLAKQ